eukprot:363203-Chlamydomonas_euryale.AAC.31
MPYDAYKGVTIAVSKGSAHLLHLCGTNKPFQMLNNTGEMSSTAEARTRVSARMPSNTTRTGLNRACEDTRRWPGRSDQPKRCGHSGGHPRRSHPQLLLPQSLPRSLCARHVMFTLEHHVFT